jgi:hypothetical protein
MMLSVAVAMVLRASAIVACHARLGRTSRAKRAIPQFWTRLLRAKLHDHHSLVSCFLKITEWWFDFPNTGLSGLLGIVARPWRKGQIHRLRCQGYVQSSIC